jgi:ankyrin repeat protein
MNINAFLSRHFHSHNFLLIDVLLIILTWGIPAFCGEIHDATVRGDLQKIKALLKENPELVSSKNNNGFTPLHTAAEMGRKDVAELLLFIKADVNARGVTGQTPLHMAASRGQKDIAELLLAKGANVSAKDTHYGGTPLHWAVMRFSSPLGPVSLSKEGLKGKRDIAELLLAKGADVNARDKEGITPLHWTTQYGDKDIAELLLAKGADVNARGINGQTPLHYTARLEAAMGPQKFKEVVELLLAKGAEVNAKAKDGMTPLHLAAWYGCKDVMELLLAKGADINARDNNNMTPLQFALFVLPGVHDNRDAVEYLRLHGGNLGEAEKISMIGAAKQPLNISGSIHDAAEKGDLQKIKTLLRDNPDLVSSKDVGLGRTPLHWAAIKGHIEVVELLLANGAAVNAKDRHGDTPLHAAAEGGRYDAAALLLAKGAEVNMRDIEGITPLSMAISVAVVDLLLQHGGHE